MNHEKLIVKDFLRLLDATRKLITTSHPSDCGQEFGVGAMEMNDLLGIYEVLADRWLGRKNGDPAKMLDLRKWYEEN